MKLADWENWFGGYSFWKADDISEDYFIGDSKCCIRVPKDYVEFGFEFDIKGGTTWPYSNVFWTAADSKNEQARNIEIKTGGTVRFASIYIIVNGRVVVNKSNFSSHIQHYFKTEDKFRVNICKTSNYSNSATRFYARKSSYATWTNKLDVTNGDHEIFISDDKSYTEFGFEFDISSGTDWPYGNAFWTADKSEVEKVDDYRDDWLC